MDSTDKHPDRQFTATQAVYALADEVQGLGRKYHGDLGEPYVRWKKRLDDLMEGNWPERDEAHRMLLAVYENSATELDFD